MNGLLQRLASRALGRPPAIRPIVGFTVPTVRADAMPHAEAPPEENEMLPPAEAVRRQRAPAREAPREVAAPAPSAEHREREGLSAFSLIRQTHGESEAHANAGETSRDRLQPQASAAAPEVVRLADDGVAPSRVQDGAASLRAEFPDLPGASLPRTIATDSEAVQMHASAATLPQAGRAATRPAFTSQRRRERPRQVSAAGEHEAERITEVHVTIGRIELTAGPAPAAPRREPAARRKAQSLEEYLARREANRS